VRYADITYVIDCIRSVLIVSDLSNEDEYQIYQLENLVTSRSSITFVIESTIRSETLTAA
jgi:hypothetical protein